ncbi:MAG: DUF6717 family protein [Chloroherpetonaceae bacterium]|nr:DUF6717 family protein [Chloroherpetonaceae bacterium]
MKYYRFYKEEDGRWYIDLPNWTGLKEELEMVSGADELLDMYADGEKEVEVIMSTEGFDGSYVADLVKEGEVMFGGGDYFLRTFNGKPREHKFWLCQVTTFVFGKFPKKIYFAKRH